MWIKNDIETEKETFKINNITAIILHKYYTNDDIIMKKNLYIARVFPVTEGRAIKIKHKSKDVLKFLSLVKASEIGWVIHDLKIK
jgi:hypothetical protein